MKKDLILLAKGALKTLGQDTRRWKTKARGRRGEGVHEGGTEGAPRGYAVRFAPTVLSPFV